MLEGSSRDELILGWCWRVFGDLALGNKLKCIGFRDVSLGVHLKNGGHSKTGMCNTWITLWSLKPYVLTLYYVLEDYMVEVCKG